MTHTLESLQAMSDEELTRIVAEEVMGWKVEKDVYESIKNGKKVDTHEMVWIRKCEFGLCPLEDWNPLKDWNHWRQVEEKLMENDRRFKIYLWGLRNEGQLGYSATAAQIDTVKADLRTRCIAAILSSQSV